MIIQKHLASTPARTLKPAKLETPPPEGDGFKPADNQPPGLLQRAGARVVHGLKNAGVNALLATTSMTGALAVTSALSAAIPGWVQGGGFLANMLIGAAVGAGVGKVGGDLLSRMNGLEGKAAEHEKFGAVTFSAAMGAIGGFGGMVASPDVIWHDPKGAAILGGTTLATSTGLAAGWGLVQGTWNGPPQR